MKLSRRMFLLSGATVGGGLIIGLQLNDKPPIPNSRQGSFQPNAWLQILNDGQVIFQCDKAEMGQGILTGLATIIAEELDFEPLQMHSEFAGIHADFRNSDFRLQLTGGSTSIKTSWATLRHAGATARAMLIAAAAQQWRVSATSLHTEPGTVINPVTGESLSYAELADSASKLAPPSQVNYKLAQDYRWIGKSCQRLDTVDKVNGNARFGIDVIQHNLKTAVVIRCPHFGGTLKSYDSKAAAGLTGNIQLKEIHSGLAVVGDSYWQARKAANQLSNSMSWNKGPLAGVCNASIEAAQLQILQQADDDIIAHKQGQLDNALLIAGDDKKIVDVIYKVGYFHHSPMEPQNASAIFHQHSGQMKIWAPSQSPDISQQVAAHFTGLDRDAIEVVTTLMGGGFGRRGYVDFVGEAAAIAKAFPDQAIKLIWSREDDMQHDYYRPASSHKLSAALDNNNRLLGWQHSIVSNSILNGFGVNMFSTLLPAWVPGKLAQGIGRKASTMLAERDKSMAEGALPEYDIPHTHIGANFYDCGIPTGFWRSVGHSYTGFVKESMMDEMAHLANSDPMAFRLQQLQHNPRLKACLNRVKALSDWDNPKPGTFRGVACHMSFNSYVAQVVELIDDNGQAKINNIFCTADVGLVINPDIVGDQLTSGIIYGLSAALKPQVNIEDGRVTGSNFHDMPVLRMNESPDMHISLIDSTEDPSGVGEIAVPPIAAALANALFGFNGLRQRQLPLSMSGKTS